MLKRFKIALITNGPISNGGVASVVAFLYRVISSTERFEAQLFSVETKFNDPINVRLLSPRSWFKGIQIGEYPWRNIPVTHVGAFLSEFEFQRYSPRPALTALLNQFDLIQVVSGGPATANVAKNIRKPVCLQMATLTRLERKLIFKKAGFLRKVYGRIMLPFISSLERQTLNQVNHIFVDTEYTRQAILPYVESAKITIDAIGVDIHLFQPVPEQLRTDDFILSVGRFDDARKNVALLIEAYAVLRSRLADTPRLILAGNASPPAATLNRASALGISDHVIVKERITTEELVALYQNASFYVLSSDEEGLGIVLLEAMACATPVITTRCGGPDTVVSEKTGFITPVGDAHALAERMLWMLQNPAQRREMGCAGRKMIESRFSEEVVGQKYLDIYDKLLCASD